MKVELSGVDHHQARPLSEKARMPPLTPRLVRWPALVAGAATFLMVAATPAHAAPADVTGLAASLAPHGLLLTWGASGTGTPVVRDVTGLTLPYDPATSGRLVTAHPTSACPVATCVLDAAFANASSATYAVWARDPDGTTSAPVTLDVSPIPAFATQTVLDVPASTIAYGKTLVLTGHVNRAGLPFPAAKLRVLSKVLGATTAATTVAHPTSAADGTVRVSLVPIRSRTYQLVLDGDVFSQASSSPTRTVRLVPHISALLSASTAPWKQGVSLHGTVTPALPGRTLAVQRWTGSAWAGVTYRTLSSTSTWSLTVAPPIGVHRYRAVLLQRTDVAGAVSTYATLTVVPRTLVQGLSGPDVLALETRLAAQHYVVGKVDGYFDSNLRHAVITFEKLQGLPRLQKWTAAEMTRVLHPVVFKVRYPSSKTTVEVDITRQLLVITKAGVISTIVDVSTGSEKVYYQDGVRNIAHTPRGRFSIYHKIDGIRISKLGELYRPSYFYKGWAIHGNGSVPTYPASHGCIRITNYVADRLFSTLAIGVPVAVYDS